jgi:hypothetical protein
MNEWHGMSYDLDDSKRGSFLSRRVEIVTEQNYEDKLIKRSGMKWLGEMIQM